MTIWAKEFPSPVAMAKYEMVAKVVMRVVITWKSLFWTGTLHDIAMNAREESNIITKTTQRVFVPASPISSMYGLGFGMTVGMGEMDGLEEEVGTSKLEVAFVFKTSMT